MFTMRRRATNAGQSPGTDQTNDVFFIGCIEFLPIFHFYRIMRNGIDKKQINYDVQLVIIFYPIKNNSMPIANYTKQLTTYSVLFVKRNGWTELELDCICEHTWVKCSKCCLLFIEFYFLVLKGNEFEFFQFCSTFLSTDGHTKLSMPLVRQAI